MSLINVCPKILQRMMLYFSRQGDTIVVHFENKSNVKQSVFHIILDIDTYPRYNFLTIDGDTFIIMPTSAKN